MLCVLDNTRNKVSDLTDSALFQDESEPAKKQTRTDIQTRLFLQARACCLSWATAPGLWGVYSIFTETLET